MTFEDWAAMDEDEPGELVDGRLEEEEVPDLIHELVVAWLIQGFGSWLGETGFVFGSDGKYAVRSNRGRKPDVAVYLHPETSLQSLEIFELIDGRYARAARATEGRLEVVPGCTGLQLDLDQIWGRISRLAAPGDR